MIKSFLICDSNGIPFYSKKIDMSIDDHYASLFSGLISAISIVGKKLFNEEIATINFGINSRAKIMILSRDFYGMSKKIFFIFLCEDEINHNKINRFITNILIEARVLLKNYFPYHQNELEKKVSRIIKSIGLFDIE